MTAKALNLRDRSARETDEMKQGKIARRNALQVAHRRSYRGYNSQAAKDVIVSGEKESWDFDAGLLFDVS